MPATRLTAIEDRLHAHGLEGRGWFALANDEVGAGEIATGTVGLLIGNHGPAMWEVFRGSAEFDDGHPHPLDRWTRRVVCEAVADDPEVLVAFPFGDRIWPFQRWAQRAMSIRPSPLGLLIHPQWGMWHALRAALFVPGLQRPSEIPDKLIHPCDGCVEKPCLTSCPVDAFSSVRYDVGACRSYLESRTGPLPGRRPTACMQTGCAARNACPVGQDLRYGDGQIRFHMQAFRR